MPRALVHLGSKISVERKVFSVPKRVNSVRKKVPFYFRLYLSHSLVGFYNFYTIGNRNEYSTITCNLLT